MFREPQTVNFPRNIPRIPPLLIRLSLKVPTDPSLDVEPLPQGRSAPPLSPEEAVQLVERRTPDPLHQRPPREFLQHRFRRGHAAENRLRRAARRMLRRPLLGEGATGRRDRRRLSGDGSEDDRRCRKERSDCVDVRGRRRSRLFTNGMHRRRKSSRLPSPRSLVQQPVPPNSLHRNRQKGSR